VVTAPSTAKDSNTGSNCTGSAIELPSTPCACSTCNIVSNHKIYVQSHMVTQFIEHDWSIRHQVFPFVTNNYF
jgi:hypothetical protein